MTSVRSGAGAPRTTGSPEVIAARRGLRRRRRPRRWRSRQRRRSTMDALPGRRRMRRRSTTDGVRERARTSSTFARSAGRNVGDAEARRPICNLSTRPSERRSTFDHTRPWTSRCKHTRVLRPNRMGHSGLRRSTRASAVENRRVDAGAPHGNGRPRRRRWTRFPLEDEAPSHGSFPAGSKAGGASSFLPSIGKRRVAPSRAPKDKPPPRRPSTGVCRGIRANSRALGPCCGGDRSRRRTDCGRSACPPRSGHRR